ncbi:MAG TPA: phosphatidylglycerophosphatase A [Opitutaceae bacterium]
MNLPEPRWPALLSTRLVVGTATLGPIGRWGRAPGTNGSLVGLLFFAVLLPRFNAIALVALAVVFAWAAVGLCGEAERRLGRKDPGIVILDEFVAMPLCFVGWQSLDGIVPAWTLLVGGFLLFRLFDIAKPLGIRRLQYLPGGWGVVADDLAAAALTCGVLHGLVRAYGAGWFGTL